MSGRLLHHNEEALRQIITIKDLPFDDFKEKFPMLSSLSIPIFFLVPPAVWNESNCVSMLMDHSDKIEIDLLKAYDEVTSRGFYLYSRGLVISASPNSESQDGCIGLDITWEFIYICTSTNHLHSFIGIDGWEYYNLSKMVGSKVEMH